MEVITIETRAFKSLIASIKEMRAELLVIRDEIKQKAGRVPLIDETAYITIKAACIKYNKDRKTLQNYRRDYPEIRVQKAGRELLIHEIDLLEAFKKGRKTKLDRSVFVNKHRSV